VKTDREYVKSSNHCPFCDSEQIEGESLDVNGNEAWQPISCIECGRRWLDIYTLIGFEERQ